jgi:hypothetical protein
MISNKKIFDFISFGLILVEYSGQNLLILIMIVKKVTYKKA